MRVGIKSSHVYLSKPFFFFFFFGGLNTNTFMLPNISDLLLICDAVSE